MSEAAITALLYLMNMELKVSTIEHLMAALFVKGIDNAIIEINGEEVPILDGSSMEFVKKIENAGIKNLNTQLKL